MSRSVQQIQNTIQAAIAADPILSQINQVSHASLLNSMTYVFASIQHDEEVLNDDSVIQVENVVNILPPATQLWAQNAAFNFQYSSANPQVIQFSTASLTPYYPTINPAYRIITNCSVTSNQAALVNILVAKGSGNSTPQQLSVSELGALQFYFNQVKPAGIQYFCNSLPADRLYSQYTIIGDSSYAGTLPNALNNAYNAYLENINFGGTIKKIDIDLTLRNVLGVIDLVCNNMIARANATPFGSGTLMVTSNLVQNYEYTTAAGYLIGETTTGQSFLNQLTIKTTDGTTIYP